MPEAAIRWRMSRAHPHKKYEEAISRCQIQWPSKNDSSEKESPAGFLNSRILNRREENVERINMLIVKTFVAASSIHGLGLFAGQFIRKGTVVWEYREGIDFRLSLEFLATLPEVVQESIRRTYNFWNGGYGVSVDNSRFINHSRMPTLLCILEPDCSVAARDIDEGEELTEDYESFDSGIVESALSVVLRMSE